MWGYMEVVCLILGPVLASQHCSHAFSVLTSLHLIKFCNEFVLPSITIDEKC